MEKSRIYILQLLSILLLICGYLLSDQPDSLSVMHFDSNPACPSVISNAVKTTDNHGATQLTVSSQDHSSRKSKMPKHISFEIILPSKEPVHFHYYDVAGFSSVLPEAYSYLFYEEINPPPPRSC